MWGASTTVLLAVVAGCYSPAPQSGSPCVEHSDCPSSLICSAITMTCERRDRAGPTVDGGPETDALADAAIDAVQIDGCSPSFEICGNGIDEDCDDMDPACAANDVAGGAINITAGGTFTGDTLLAKDDVLANGCGGNGGRDLFYRVTLSSPQVYYFDTFGSAFDSVVRVYAKSCATVGTGAGAKACVDNACTGDDSQVAVSLPAGESCIVIDQVSAAQTMGNLTLRVVPGGRDGMPLAAGVQTITGDTTAATNVTEPVNVNCDAPGSGGRDHAYFFTTCPAQTLLLDATMCPQVATWDPVLYVKRVNGNQIGCNDDTCGQGPEIKNVSISGSTLYFLYVDGFASQHFGPYSVATNLRP